MTHYLLELGLWILLVFFIGCILGCLLRNWFGTAEITMPQPAAAVPVPPVPPVPPAKPAPLVAAPMAPRAPVAPVMETGKAERPKGISGPRGGKPDKLQRISGVGPKNEVVLHNLGFFHFDQIAAWTAEQVDWVDDHLKFNGRIRREEWIKQCRLLADGNEKEFGRLYGTGGMKNAGGETESGARTRK
jgi:predicted flap endonuclease-1-like 5' DNA nuclease